MLPVKLVYAALHNEISKLEELKKTRGIFHKNKEANYK
jgi:hypothetical protein